MQQSKILWTVVLIVGVLTLAVLIIKVFEKQYRRRQETRNDLQAIHLVDPRALTKDRKAQPRILIITLETRPLGDLISTHNRSVEEYAHYHGYEYRFQTAFKSDMPVYWNKIEWMLEILEKEQFDYVLWLDSDTLIVQQRVPLTALIRKKPDADIFIGFDGDPWHKLIEQLNYNAGVFMVRNSKLGKKFLQDCINQVLANPRCQQDGSTVLAGKWAGMCYEQGVMNQLLRNRRFRRATCVLRPPLVDNGPARNRLGTSAYLIVHRFGNKDVGLETFKSIQQDSEELPVVKNQKPLRICILLTIYGEPSRSEIYSQSLQKWSNLTGLPLFVVDSYGNELLAKDNPRYRYLSYNEVERNSSKAERNAIKKAIDTFGYEITQYDLICKVTGKYWIPGLEETLEYIPDEAEIIVQRRKDTCGQNSEIFAIKPALMSAFYSSVEETGGVERGIKLLSRRPNKVYRFPVFGLESPVKRADGSRLRYL